MGVIPALVTPERMEPVAANDNLPLFEPTVFEWEDPTALPVRDWIYGKHLIRRHVSATIASGAVDKTSLKIVGALALATGRALLGQDVPKRSRVWLFNLEDDMVELRRRVSAAMIHYKIKPEDIGDRLHIDGEKSLVITKTTRQGTVINVPVVDAVVEAIEALEIDVLFVDPFISSHDAPESDSGAMDLVMKSGWVRVAREGNCAVELCHHTTKADSSSGMATAMSGRGGGAVVFACRSVQVLNPMSHEEAKAAALESPVGYFSAKDDKQNLTLKTGARDWPHMQKASSRSMSLIIQAHGLADGGTMRHHASLLERFAASITTASCRNHASGWEARERQRLTCSPTSRYIRLACPQFG
jgi:RecA-family ATPase